MTDHTEARHDASDAGLDAIVRERRRLVGLAYRLLGSLTEAEAEDADEDEDEDEDAVQEGRTRWYAMYWQQRDAIEFFGAWLTTVAPRACLDLLR